jgi:hypothetical protein
LNIQAGNGNFAAIAGRHDRLSHADGNCVRTSIFCRLYYQESPFSSSEWLKLYCSGVSLQAKTASANAKWRDAAPFWDMAA